MLFLRQHPHLHHPIYSPTDTCYHQTHIADDHLFFGGGGCVEEKRHRWNELSEYVAGYKPNRHGDRGPRDFAELSEVASP